MNTKLGIKNNNLKGAFDNTEPKDWEFIILAEVPPENLNKAENDAIARAQSSALCLNGTTARMPVSVEKLEADTALSTVLDENGRPLTRREIAARLGVSPDSVKKRLAAWRLKGKIHWKITDL